MPVHRSRRVTAAVLLATLAVAACGGGGGGGASPATTTAAPATTAAPSGGPTSTTAPTDAPDACPPPASPPPPVEVRPAVVGGGLLTGLEVVGSPPCTDDVTFTFRLPEAPGGPVVVAGYQDGPFLAAGSGEAVAVAGHAFLVVRLEPAYTADLSTERAPPTYTGPRRLATPDARHVREVVLVDDFEAVVTWVVGLETLRAFEVAYLDGTTVRVRLT